MTSGADLERLRAELEAARGAFAEADRQVKTLKNHEYAANILRQEKEQRWKEARDRFNECVAFLTSDPCSLNTTTKAEKG